MGIANAYYPKGMIDRVCIPTVRREGIFKD